MAEAGFEVEMVVRPSLAGAALAVHRLPPLFEAVKSLEMDFVLNNCTCLRLCHHLVLFVAQHHNLSIASQSATTTWSGEHKLDRRCFMTYFNY